MAVTTSWDGVQFGARVDGMTERRLYGKVVDNVMNAPTYFSRNLSMGVPFNGKIESITMDVTSDAQGEFFTGLETFNSAAANTTVTANYAHTAFTQPKVSIMLDSFSNAGQQQTIPLDAFKWKKAASETLQRYGSTIYADGTASRPLGLAAIVDDGTGTGTIGGVSRSTYTTLVATLTSWTTLTLAKVSTLHDAVSAAGLVAEEPTVGLAGKTVWSYFESLLSPSVRASYDQVGYDKVPTRGKLVKKGDNTLQAGSGFTAISHRATPILKDDFATTQKFFWLNENYYDWHGRTIVPDEYKGFIEKVDLGTKSGSYEGTGASAMDMPSEYNGFFYQKPMMLPNQAGTIARFYVIGQEVPTGFRRSGAGTSITGI